MTSLRQKFFQIVMRWTRGKTLGARVVVINAQNEVLLVRPGYVTGWTLPGGGVDRGETMREAALRELREETAVEALEPLAFHGIFSNDKAFPGDHVACFVLHKFQQNKFTPNWEIREARFFKLDALPDGTSAGSLARIAEVFQGAAISDYWIP